MSSNRCSMASDPTAQDKDVSLEDLYGLWEGQHGGTRSTCVELRCALHLCSLGRFELWLHPEKPETIRVCCHKGLMRTKPHEENAAEIHRLV